MSRTQRFVLLGLAAIVAVGALVVLPGSGDDEPDTAERAAESQPAEPAATSPSTTSGTATTTATPPPEPAPPMLQAGNPRELTFTKGETVRFRVRHSGPEEVHVHGYDISRELEAGKTRTLSFPANIEGIFEIELEQSGTELGTLKVEPK